MIGRKSIIDSATSPFETAATGSRSSGNGNFNHNINNNHSGGGGGGGSSMAATLDRDIGERRHLEDVTNHTTSSSAMNNNNIHQYNNNNGDGYGSENENQRKAKLVIGTDVTNLDPVSFCVLNLCWAPYNLPLGGFVVTVRWNCACHHRAILSLWTEREAVLYRRFDFRKG